MYEPLVISGVSGRYPEASDLEQFWSNLLAGKDCLTADGKRWPMESPLISPRTGKLLNCERFDGEFFKLSKNTVEHMYVCTRLLHEVIYEAFIDAGFSQNDENQSRKVGFFLGQSALGDQQFIKNHDAELYAHQDLFWVTHHFNIKGPTVTVDTGCASIGSSLDIAVKSIYAGDCDQAIVAGFNYCYDPGVSRGFIRMKMNNMEGRSKCLDKNANGYGRSESVGAILIQRASDAKRVYASILNVKTNCDGYTREGITFPRQETQGNLITELFQQIDLNPLQINYVESHSTGTQAGDKIECATLLATVRPNSEKPLLVGCLKSNIGHSEGASGLSAISKVVKIFQTGLIPANLHFKEPNPKIEGLVKGILKPVLKNTQFNEDLILINSFGWGGVNNAFILKANPKRVKDDDRKLSDKYAPRLVNFNNRTSTGLYKIIDFLNDQKGSLTKYTLALLNDMSKITPSMGFNHRGYLLLNDEQKIIHKTLKQNLSPDKMSPWFIFTTMFDVSSHSFNHLMNLPLINSRLKLMQTKQLTSHGIDIIKIIESNQQDLTNFLISSIAIQIALCDLVVKHLGIKPEGIIGHSIGLIAAAYADNCITDEDALLIGYHIGEACKQFKGQGTMVCVNLPWEQVEKIKSKDVEIASHESKDWTMVTGEKQAIENFIKNIDKVKILSVNTKGIPFGSSLLSKVSQLAEQEINKLLTSKSMKPSLLSMSCLNFLNHENDGNMTVGKAFTNFLTSPCSLNEITTLLPLNTCKLIIGSSSHDKSSSCGSIKFFDSFGDEIISVEYSSIILSLYKAFGQMYLHGLNPLIENLYDPIEYPVPRETQHIGHLIEWKHDTKYFLPGYRTNFQNFSKYYFNINLVDQEWNFLIGHKIGGRILFPASGYLYSAWQLICFAYDIDANKHPIEFTQVQIHRAMQFKSTSDYAKCFIKLDKAIGTFSLYMNSLNDDPYVTGKYCLVHSPSLTVEMGEGSDHEIVLGTYDVYKEFTIRGYDYSGSFQGIEEASSKGNWGMVKDTGHWISFADSCCQVTLLNTTSRKLIIPINIEYAYLHPPSTMDSLNAQSTESGTNSSLKVYYNPVTKVLSTKGFVIKNIVCEELKRKFVASNTKISIHHQFPFDSEHELPIDEKDEQTKYSSYCLELIKLLNDVKSNKLVDRNNVNDVENDDRSLMDGHESKILLQTLLEMKRKILGHSTGQSDLYVDDEIDKIYQQYKSSLVEDDLFKKPLSILFDQMFNIIQFNLKTKSNLIGAVNFLRIPSEISFNITQLFSVSSDANEYFISSAFSDSMVSEAGGSFELFDVNKKEELNLGRLFKVIVVRDKSTYLMLQDSTPEEKCNQFDCDFLQIIFNSLEEGGFCVLLTRSKLTPVELELQKLIGNNQEINFDLAKLKSVADEAGFIWICCKQMTDEGYCSVLLRRPFVPNPGQKISFIRVKIDQYDWINKIKEAGKDENHKIWLIGGEHDNGLTGLAKSLMHDARGYNVRCYYDPSKGDDEEIIVPEDILIKDLTLNQVDANGKVGMGRSLLVDIDEPKVQTPSCYADVITNGDLSSLRWFQSAQSNWTHIPKEKLIFDHDTVTIYYGALNFKDILVATGRVPLRSYVLEEKFQHSPTIGLEYSGIDSSGNRIMGLTDVGGIGTSLVAYSSYAKIQVPDEWTLAEAATVPVVYLTAYYGLITRGNMRNGESVLIHAGSGGVGQAAISICLARGCEVFTTVGTQEKRDFIKKRFPSIDDDHIGDSRSTSFEDLIMRMTNGRGVDLVLNSLSDDKLTASVRCLTDFGRFIEIGKYDMVQNTKMNSNSMDFNKTFHACCLAFLQDEVLRQKVPERIRVWNQLLVMLNEGIRSGEVVPLPSTIFQMNQLEESFRFMATGKHIGKVLIQMRDETEDPNVVKLYPAIGQTFFDLEKSYIITGGLGGLGLEVAFWMVQRGATNLILTSRSGVKTKYQEYMLDRIRNNNYTRTNVLISNEDCYTYESAERLINQAKELGPVGGIIFSALVLDDAIFENRTIETFKKAIYPKAIACRHLDKCTRSLPYKLNYFVGFSSIANEFGNVGQDNYCYGNAAVENICYKRHLDGHHGLAIRWGPIGDVGALYQTMKKLAETMDESELLRLPLVLNILEKIFCTDESIYTVFTAPKHKSVDLSGAVSLKQQMLNILGIRDVTKVDPKMSLGELGLDSLMAIEIGHILESDYDCLLTTQEIRDMKISEIDRITIKSTNCQSSSKTSVKNQDQQLTKTEMFVPLNKVETGQSTYFYFPNIDEIQTNIESLFESLSIPVVGVNYVKDSTHLKEIEDIIDFHVNLLLTNYPNVKSYNLIGHSIGGAIALKVAIGLQKKLGINFCKNLIILDSVSEIMTSNDFRKQNATKNDKTWIETFINNLVNLNEQNQVDLAKLNASELEKYQMSYKIISSLKPGDEFNGDIALISESIVTNNESTALVDCGLEKHISGQVHLFNVTNAHDIKRIIVERQFKLCNKDKL